MRLEAKRRLETFRAATRWANAGRKVCEGPEKRGGDDKGAELSESRTSTVGPALTSVCVCAELLHDRITLSMAKLRSSRQHGKKQHVRPTSATTSVLSSRMRLVAARRQCKALDSDGQRVFARRAGSGTRAGGSTENSVRLFCQLVSDMDTSSVGRQYTSAYHAEQRGQLRHDRGHVRRHCPSNACV